MTTIVDFLKQRYDEREAIARAGAAHLETLRSHVQPNKEIAELVELAWPDDILADITAKRLMVADHEGWHRCDYGDMIEPYAGCRTLKLLALPYQSHPDVHERWRLNCGATTIFWPDAEACDASCIKTEGHDGDHEDEILGEWEREQW